MARSQEGEEMKKEAVVTKQAPAAIGPYSQAIKINGLVFASGQIPLSPQTGDLVGEDVASQTRQCLDNVAALLAASGTGLDRVVKTTVFITDMADFPIVNEVYATYFTEVPPARSCVAVVALPRGAKVEIEVIATVNV